MKTFNSKLHSLLLKLGLLKYFLFVVHEQIAENVVNRNSFLSLLKDFLIRIGRCLMHEFKDDDQIL